jgi:hypothetical protein
MTIYLPEDVRGFRQAFDEICDRIQRSEQDTVFYDLFLLLAANLRKHPLLKNCILELESKSENLRQEFNRAVLRILEDCWERLWKYYPRLTQRRKLVRIKQMITDSEKKVSCIPYREVRLMKDDQGNPYLWIDPELGNISRERNPKMHDRQLKWLLENGDNKDDPRRKGAYDLFSDPSSQQSSSIYRRGLSCISKFCSSENTGLDSFLSDTSQIEKFCIPGRNNFEKNKKMQSLAETNLVFCWERIKFLESCIAANGALPIPKQWKGRWAAVRKLAWKTAFERSDMETLHFAKMSFCQKQSLDFRSDLDCFLSVEYQIDRKNYEKYLGSLKNHVHAQLFKIESAQQNENNDRLILPGTQKDAFVIDLAAKCWKKNPGAKYDEVYQDYLINCPSSRWLSRTSWERIIRKAKIDPRPKEAKKRGPGKKTLQN